MWNVIRKAGMLSNDIRKSISGKNACLKTIRNTMDPRLLKLIERQMCLEQQLSYIKFHTS